MTRRARLAGVTLMELMVATAIISLILGVGAAFLTGLSRGYRLTAAADSVAGVIRSASAHASWLGVPSKVEFDAKAHTIRAIGGRPTGQWHFEAGSEMGAFNRRAEFVGPVSTTVGAVGDGLALDDEAEVRLGTIGSFGIDAGFLLEVWIHPLATSSNAAMIARVGRGVELALVNDLSLGARAGGVAFRTVSGAVPLYRWTLVQLAVDPKRVALRVDHVELASMEFSDAAPPWRPDSAGMVQLGDRRSSFVGTLDEVRLDDLTTVEEYEFPPRILFVRVPPDGFLAFDHEGRLDLAHPPEEGAVIHSETREKYRVVRVARSGRVATEDYEPPSGG